MSKRSFRIGAFIVLLTGFGLLAGGFFLWTEMKHYPFETRAGSGQVITVIIPKGASFPTIANLLEEKGVVDRPRWFRVYAMNRGVTTKVRSGAYQLQNNMSPKEVLDILLRGVKEVTVSITIAEGLNMIEVFELFEKKGIADKEALEALAWDPVFLKSHGIDGVSVEGTLFPETYRFLAPTDPGKVLERLIAQYRRVWEKVRRSNERQLRKIRRTLKWSDQEILIMASIVEKEAVLPVERARIAQVFINRLISPKFVPHRLDTDPTIRYGCTVPRQKSAACKKWDPSSRLRRIQLTDTENPYNTYRHAGLPPGPICSPGEASLRATLNPDGSNYFFFVATERNGAHAFSRSRNEHRKKVDKYQR